MHSHYGKLAAIAMAGITAAGCAQTGDAISTASVAPEKTAAAQPKVDPACVSLANQIDTLRKEGTIEKLEKASSGKTANVQVKRASLAKQAELNKANADFQTRCGPAIPHAQSAAVVPAPAAVAPAAAATAATAQAAPASAQTAAAGVAKQAVSKAAEATAAQAVTKAQ